MRVKSEYYSISSYQFYCPITVIVSATGPFRMCCIFITFRKVWNSTSSTYACFLKA